MDTTLTTIMLTLKRLGTVQIMFLLKFRRTKKQHQRQRRKHTLEHTKKYIENHKIQFQKNFTVTLIHTRH